jgi:hypothetical protein
MGILFGLSYLVSPIVLIWGWAQWVLQPKLRTVPSILSLVGFVLATTSALLAVLSIGYAQIHHFPYYDPLLLRIFRSGTLLSLSGILFGISGVWRPSSLRWYAPASAVATIAFWVLAAVGE